MAGDQDVWFSFVIREVWNPVTDQFGALAAIYGTVVTSAIAMAIAVPAGFGIALFLTEFCPPLLKRPIGTAVELLAAVPSIIFGIWGLFVLAPLLQRHVQPWLIEHLGTDSRHQPVVHGAALWHRYFDGRLRARHYGLAVHRGNHARRFRHGTAMLKESGYGLGATTWEVIWHVVVPHSRAGIVGGIMLGLGRALGETMAVTFVIGNAHRISSSLLAPGTTISSAIANESTEAVGGLYTSSLIALGLLLFIITFTVIAAAQAMLRRLERRALISL